ncbi:MAG: hypothetical protein ACLQCB_00410 [Spirochaetia bacterium]
MSPLGMTGALVTGERTAPRPIPQALRGPAPRSPGLTGTRAPAPHAAGPSIASRLTAASSSLSAASPQAVIRQAEMLLQIASANASSPALRQIAAAAYQMEIDARREMARVPDLGSGRGWFA